MDDELGDSGRNGGGDGTVPKNGKSDNDDPPPPDDDGDELLLEGADFSPFFPLALGTPGAIVAAAALVREPAFGESHLRTLCRNGITGTRLHVFFKHMCGSDAKVARRLLERFEDGEVPERLEELRRYGWGPPVGGPETNEMVAALECPVTRLVFTPGAAMRAMIGRLPPPSSP